MRTKETILRKDKFDLDNDIAQLKDICEVLIDIRDLLSILIEKEIISSSPTSHE